MIKPAARCTFRKSLAIISVEHQTLEFDDQLIPVGQIISAGDEIPTFAGLGSDRRIMLPTNDAHLGALRIPYDDVGASRSNLPVDGAAGTLLEPLQPPEAPQHLELEALEALPNLASL